MKLTTKASLLSALVFPGAGHVYLKKYLKGGVLVTIALMAFVFILVDAMTQVQLIVDQVLLGKISGDIQTIVQKVQSRPTSISLYIAYAALFFSWLVGVVDSFRLAKQKIQQEQ